MSQPRASVLLGAILRDVLEAVVLASVLFLVLQLGIQNTIVDGASMEPNFVNQEWLLVNKLAYRAGTPARGDVIVFLFTAPDGTVREFIKRVIALPGERVSLREGSVLIDGQILHEPWMPWLDQSSYGPYEVPQGQLFVLGDNRANSNDSRVWGGLDMSQVVGRAAVSIWPQSTWGLIRSDRPGPAQAPAAALIERMTHATE
jgi:signal peptidase I